jgi:hypothetical protein
MQKKASMTNEYMTQLIQISHLMNFCSGLADQGGVLEGVADKPFFRTSPSRALCLFETVR